MAKDSTSSSTDDRAKRVCVLCSNEFKGRECPECGNMKDNQKLASDGIPHIVHQPGNLFGTVNELRRTDDIVTSQRQLHEDKARMQQEEMLDNLREANVVRSKIKLDDLEMERVKKRAELERVRDGLNSDTVPHSHTNQPTHEEPQQFSPFMPMSSMSPQSVFIQQLMKMDKNKRQDFIEQLSDADPAALANLSAMFATPQQPAYNPANHPMMNIPPWMQPWMYGQQQPQQQTHQQDSISIATDMVNTIFDIIQRSAPKQDDSLKDVLGEFKNELKRVHDRIDTVISKERDREAEPILAKISSLERRLSSDSSKKTVVDQINEITQLVDGLEKVGLVTRASAQGKSVDDELRVKEFEFTKEKETRQQNLEEKKIEAEQARNDLNRNIVTSLLQRGIARGVRERLEEEEPAHHRLTKVRTQTVPKKQEPAVIIDEVQAEGGVVRETREPVKRKNEVLE